MCIWQHCKHLISIKPFTFLLKEIVFAFMVYLFFCRTSIYYIKSMVESSTCKHVCFKQASKMNATITKVVDRNF